MIRKKYNYITIKLIRLIFQGEQILGVPLKRPCQATAAAWHPTRKVLAVGWENGEILVWNVDAKEMYESTHIHKAALSIIHWSSNGTRLATGDTVRQFDCLWCSLD